MSTNENGVASFDVTFPDDVTSWKTIALAMDDKKRSGSSEGLIKSFKPVMGSIKVPRFLIEEDSVVILGKALNYTNDTINVNTHFEVNDVSNSLNNTQLVNSFIDTLTLVAHSVDTTTVAFVLEKDDGYFDGEKREIPVLAKGTEETIGQFVALDQDTTITFSFDKSLGDITFSIQADLLEVFLDEVNHVKKYKYLCNEQASSKLKALLIEKEIRTNLGQEFQHEKRVEKLISRLEKARNNRHLWGWWPQGATSNWVSSYTISALAEAKKAGYEVQYDFDKFVEHAIYELEKGNTKSTLALLPTLQSLNSKFNAKRSLILVEQDSLISQHQYIQLAQTKQMYGLPYNLDSIWALKKETIFGNLYWGYDSYFLNRNAISTTLLVYEIIRKHGGYEKELAKIRNYLLEKRTNGHWTNTYESMQILQTILPDVLRKGEKIVPSKIVFEEGLNDTIDSFPHTKEISAIESVRVTKIGSSPVYLAAYQKFQNPKSKKVDKDFAVDSYFLNQNKDTVNNLIAGSKVKLAIRLKVKKDVEYVMLEIPIPAGCSYGEKKQPRRNNEVHREYFKNMTSIFCRRLTKGTYKFEVELIPRYSGRFTLNPVKADLMYFPVFYGREQLKSVFIK